MELWALLYLHNWSPVDPETGVQPVWPEIHGVYTSWQAAEESRKGMIDPSKYWVRRAKQID